MRLADILDTAGSIAQPSEPLWTLLSEELIPDEDIRKLMLRQAFRYEIEAAKANDLPELERARQLRKFLMTAPIGISLSIETTEAPLVTA